MPNQALYLTYRPTRFAELQGQAPVVSTLTQAVANDRVAHAYLFSGPRGTGKTSAARLLAKALNCEKPLAGEPDNACRFCTEISAGRSLDVLEIDAASNRGIDEIRELRDKVAVTPTAAKRKVYIIDEVHMLTKEAFNALLKTLEEPPEHAVFILATTEPSKVPETIHSRCQRFEFRPATTVQLAEHLASIAQSEGFGLEPAAAELIARTARGSFRDGLSVLDLLRAAAPAKAETAALSNKSTTTKTNAAAKTTNAPKPATAQPRITAATVRQTLGLADLSVVAELERALAGRQTADALQLIRTVSAQGIAPEALRAALVEYLRTILLAAAGVAGESSETTALAADWTLPRLTAAIRAYVAAGELSGTAVIAELPLELATVEFLSEAEARPVSGAVPVAPPQAPPTRPDSPAPQPANPHTAAPPTPAAPPAPNPPADPAAAKLWEALLVATKHQYSLTVCLQKTRPSGLSGNALTLAVQSDFFLKKLQDPQTKAKVEQHASEAAGRAISLVLEVDESGDIFEEAVALFEGATVE